jgi:hypothetical protein
MLVKHPKFGAIAWAILSQSIQITLAEKNSDRRENPFVDAIYKL